MSSLTRHSGLARRAAGLAAIATLLAAALQLACKDDPEAPPPPQRTDGSGHFDAGAATMTIVSPAGSEALRIQVSGVTSDIVTGTVSGLVRFHNNGTTRMVGPAGVAVYEISPVAVTPGTGSVCDPADANAPEVPADACLISHLETYGGDGMLSPGETSDGIPWTFQGWAAGDFSFHFQLVATGFASSGEITGVVYEDANSNGRRDADELGIPGAGVGLQYPDSLTYTGTDGAGRYSFHVVTLGNYLLSKPSLCCATGATNYPVEIRLRPDGTLTGFSGGEFGCSPGTSSAPQVVHVDVRRLGSGLPPCVAAEPCTIPFGTSFAIRSTGRDACNSLSGIQWQSIRPGDVNPEPFQPFGTDTQFLPFAADTAGASDGGYTWSMHDDTLTVSYLNQAPDTLRSGTLALRVRVRNAEGRVSILSEGTRRVTINLDPDTRLPLGCPSIPENPPRPLGWITGVDVTAFPIDAWIPFCERDTVPARARVRFFAEGNDDPRDAPIDPTQGLRKVGFSYRYTWRAYGLQHLSMPFSQEYPSADVPLPGGGSLRGGAIGWQPCPYDFTFFAAAVDEHGKRDGTPDSLVFYADGAPAIDSIVAPQVLVLVPDCGPVAGLCPDRNSLPVFGPDTVVTVGRYIPAPGGPLGLGANRFVLPIAAYAHDHPRDRNAPGRVWYEPEHEGRVKAWRFGFDCSGALECQDLNLPGEETWRPDVVAALDPANQQVFDDSLRLTVQLDTLCTGSPPCSEIRAVLAADVTGPWEFRLQGRDWMDEPCGDQSDLGPNPVIFLRPPWGRETPEVRRTLQLVQYHELRRPTAKPAPVSPFARLRRALR